MDHGVRAVHVDGHRDSLGDGDGLVDIGLLADHIRSGGVVDGNGGGAVSNGDRGTTVAHGDGGGSRVSGQSVAVSVAAVAGDGSVSQVAGVQASVAVAVAQVEQTALVQLLLQGHLLTLGFAGAGGGHQQSG